MCIECCLLLLSVVLRLKSKRVISTSRNSSRKMYTIRGILDR